jgi:ipoprotein LpqH
METRRPTVAVAACLVALGAAACSSPEPALGGTTATVTIDGNDAGGTYPVTCKQTGFTWYIQTTSKDKGFTAVLATDGPAQAKSVEFRDMGGFSGNFWADNIGDADVTGQNGRYTISGTADGNFADKPSDAATAKFRIIASC